MQVSIEPAAATLHSADQLPILSQWTLVRRRFLRHRLATVGLFVVVIFYVAALLADFIAYADPRISDPRRALVSPQPIHFVVDGRWAPHVHVLAQERDPATLGPVYHPTSERVPVGIFVRGHAYRLFGILPTDRHLFGTVQPSGSANLFLLGSDHLGRDQFSRLAVAIRTSLTIGLVAVAVSLALGTLMGVLSGFFGGYVDLAIQRLIEILRAIPTIPLWMALAAAIPATWGITSVYLAVTLIIALIGWTELARELRGRILQLRNEDFVVAAELCGAGPGRIMFVHLLPLCTSHIIATTTLAIPAMIASETALGFLGLGLRAPAISLGVLLNGAQNVQSFSLYPWLLLPVIPTALVILAFNFLGDGLRDAADPYA